MTDPTPLIPALEKGVYASFRQTEMSWRVANIATKLIDYRTLQLPNNAVLHVVDHLLTPGVHSVLPDISTPFIHNEKYPVYLDNVLAIPGATAVFPITERYRFRPASFNQEIRQFWQDHPQIKRAPTLAALLQHPNTLAVVNYNPVLTALVTGTFDYYRRFDLLLRTILNTVVSIAGRHQFLQINLSRTVYSKVKFAQTFDKISYLTVRIKDDPSFYFLLHLVNFLSKSATTSLFNQLTPVQLDQLNVVLTAGDKAIIYNLGDLKAMLERRQDNTLYQLVVRHINALKLAGYADYDISTLDESAYDRLIDDVSPTTTPVETEHAAPASPPAAAPVLSKSQLPSFPAAHTPDNPAVPVVHQAAVKPPSETAIVTGGPQQIEPESPPLMPSGRAEVGTVLQPYDPKALTSVIDHAAYQLIMGNTQLSEPQKQRALQLAQSYKTLVIDGVSVATLLNQTAEPDIATSHLDFLQAHVPDASMLNSTAVNLDRHYLEHMMARDLAAVAAQLTAQGMFLVGVTQQDEITQLDRIRHYKLTYEDLTGRTHRVAFKFPIIASDGTILINGIESRMIKQQVNLPICKVDTWRVSLASNYNKTLVERVSTRAHNYSAYITKYITAVYKADVGLTLNYGQLTTDTVLPYDYTSIAKRYSQLRFGAYKLVFDYEQRFDILQAVAYDEGDDSTFTHNDTEYSVTALLKETAALPTQMFRVDQLRWAFDDNQPDPDRSIDDVELTAPILVTQLADGRLMVVDGMHRLAKAIARDRKVIPGKLIPPEMMAAHVIGQEVATEALLSKAERQQQKLLAFEKTYGVYCGYYQTRSGRQPLFFGYDNKIRMLDTLRPQPRMATLQSFADIFFAYFSDKVPPPKQLSEWTELKILDKNFPVVFILGFQFGLKRTLDHIKLAYTFYANGTKFTRTSSTIVVPFADGQLVFDRYPLEKSFVASGLLKFDTKPYAFEKFDLPDGYYTLLADNELSMNYLKGISSFFQLFVDPITRDVLVRMHEPTDVAGLLLRATQMLTTDDALPAASMRNHRLRGYERFNATLYNEMARAYATFSNQRGSRKVFSINPEAVFLRLIQDQTLRIVDEINPVENIKDMHSVTYSGSGGRTAQSFVIEDRRYPDDGIGVLSECTPDNGKVGINTYTTANPAIANVRGMFDLDKVNKVDIQPSQVLSPTTLLMPCATNDDRLTTGFF